MAAFLKFCYTGGYHEEATEGVLDLDLDLVVGELADFLLAGEVKLYALQSMRARYMAVTDAGRKARKERLVGLIEHVFSRKIGVVEVKELMIEAAVKGAKTDGAVF